MFPIIWFKKLKGRAGFNLPGVAVVDPDTPFLAAVVAQEAWEAMHKLHPRLVRIVASKLLWRVDLGNGRAVSDMEVMGHECEVQAAAIIYDRNPNQYRAAEVDRMRRGYDGLFDRFSRTSLLGEMKARSGDARQWVLDNLENLERRK